MTATHESVLLVGQPNVGKSALFNRLTGRYVTVSNYPGTTVEIARGHSRLLGADVEVVDTPGLYSLLPITEDERVASDLLSAPGVRAVVHVVDAQNLDRMLGLALQLIETGLPVVVALNMYDEARESGLVIHAARLEEILGVPVVPTVSTTGEGVAELAARLRQAPPRSSLRTEYGSIIEDGMRGIASHLPQGPLSVRSEASLILQGDARARERLLARSDDRAAAEILRIAAQTAAQLNHSPHYYVTLALRTRVAQILSECVQVAPRHPRRLRAGLDRLLTHPVTGSLAVAVVLYLLFYQFVGRFGAGVLVDALERGLFRGLIIPGCTRIVEAAIPWPAGRDLFVGEYGVISLGLRYAVAIILPMVGTFFLAFAVLEDSGYLPRLALLVDRVFKRIGLNGRAVIPMVLGFGCDTMATLVTRTLETRRERILCTLLLALAIPCSAQLGVILGLLAGHPGGLLTWGGTVLGVLLAVGFLAARILPGESPLFYMELPPLRRPIASNVLAKTYSRMIWYVREVLPLFLLVSLLLWLGQTTRTFALVLRAMSPALRGMGLPTDAAPAFLLGFFRRDYGAAGLYDLQKAGRLTGNQLTVAAITLTLFLPCVAQFLVMLREHGVRATLAISGFVLAVAYGVGVLVNGLLEWTGTTL